MRIRRPYPDIVIETDAIANVKTRSRKAQVDDNDAREELPEAYAQVPASLKTQDIIRA